MAHIHTGKNQIDLTVHAHIVYGNKTLLRLHDKYHKWLPPGGHVELNETPEEAVVRETKEEVGLDIVLWKGNKAPDPKVSAPDYHELIPPYYMYIHNIDENHRHMLLAYAATSQTYEVIEPDGQEKKRGMPLVYERGTDRKRRSR